MGSFVFDIQQAYNRQFGSKPKVPQQEELREMEGFKIQGENPVSLSRTGSSLTAQYLGQEIWLPIKFFELDVNVFGVSELLIPYAVIKISGKKTIVKTPLVERRGSVKEQYSVEDYQISIKGFLIGRDDNGLPLFPETEITTIKNLFELNEAVRLDNALSNIFLGNDTRVVIEELDFPEVEAGKKNFRPFSMKLESDSIFTLDL